MGLVAAVALVAWLGILRGEADAGRQTASPLLAAEAAPPSDPVLKQAAAAPGDSAAKADPRPLPGDDRPALKRIPIMSRTPRERVDQTPQRQPASPPIEQPAPVSLAPAPMGEPGADLAEIRQLPLFAGAPDTPESRLRTHHMAPGETLAAIARKNRVTTDFLMKLNAVRDPRTLRAGQTLRIVEGPFRAVVDKSRFTLDIYLDDVRVETFAVGLGKDGKTPRGSWRVLNKLANPSWVNPTTAQRFAADDPANPIGERWLGLEGVSGEAVGKIGFGIHGTVDPASIGQNSSLGCIRLMPRDIERVYEFLVEGASTVDVR